MVRVSPPRALLMGPCRYGMLMMAASPSSIAAIVMMWTQWLGRPMAHVSPPAHGMRCRCGRPCSHCMGGETVAGRFSGQLTDGDLWHVFAKGGVACYD